MATKLAALALLGIALAYPDLGGLKSKGAGVRAVIYPLGLVALPLLCALVRWWRPALRLNWRADLMCSLPILVDLAGNRADLFDTVWWWDDAMHLAMHGLLTAGVLLQFAPRASLRDCLVASAAFAGLSGLVWELGEYAAFMRFGVELSGAYLDTLGDLSGGMVGSLVAGLAVGLRHRPVSAPIQTRAAGPGRAGTPVGGTSPSPSLLAGRASAAALLSHGVRSADRR